MSTNTPQSKAPSIRFTVSLSILLFVPFAINLMITEPYPAVIMPSGSGRIDISEGKYNFSHLRAYGVTESGEREALDVEELIEPAHEQYLYVIFENQFGLRPDPQEVIKLRGTEWKIASYLQPGATPENQTKYRSRLKTQLGNRYEKILLESVIVVGDLKTRKWIQETPDESILIEL